VESYNTGLPISEVIPADPPPGEIPQVPLAPLRMPEAGRGTGEAARMRQDVFSLAEGEVVMRWPTPLSQDSIDEIKDWLKIVERKISRSTAVTEEQKET